MLIRCCQCDLKKIEARLTDGSEIYPYRPDLSDLPFWICDTCHNFVGCHHKTKDRTRPLGNIPTPEIKEARKHIHKLLDPLWRNGKFKRKELYKILSDKLGYGYHTAMIRDLAEARTVYKILIKLGE